MCYELIQELLQLGRVLVMLNLVVLSICVFLDFVLFLLRSCNYYCLTFIWDFQYLSWLYVFACQIV